MKLNKRTCLPIHLMHAYGNIHIIVVDASWLLTDLAPKSDRSKLDDVDNWEASCKINSLASHFSDIGLADCPESDNKSRNDNSEDKGDK